MKALSIKQPWASLIVSGFKTIENRKKSHGFKTPFPQRIAIHASLKYDDNAPLRVFRISNVLSDTLLHLKMALSFTEDRVPRGALIGVCDLLDGGPTEIMRAKYPDDAVWIMRDTPWCYVIRNAYTFEPISYRGQLGFFEVPDDIIPAAMRERLGA